MGYCVDMDECNIFIDKNNFESIISEIKKFCTDKKRISWANVDEVLESDLIEEVLESFRWGSKFDENGNINYLDFFGEKLGEELKLFEIILKYSKEGSYVTMHGEDGDKWRYHYVDGEYGEIRPNF